REIILSIGGIQSLPQSTERRSAQGRRNLETCGRTGQKSGEIGKSVCSPEKSTVQIVILHSLDFYSALQGVPPSDIREIITRLKNIVSPKEKTLSACCSYRSNRSCTNSSARGTSYCEQPDWLARNERKLRTRIRDSILDIGVKGSIKSETEIIQGLR